MHKIWAVLVVLIAGVTPLLAVEGREVRLIESTVAGVAPETVGAFDLTQPERLVFQGRGQAAIVMPYAKITAYASHAELTHHLGVAGAVVVGLIKKRQRGHFLTVTYNDEHDVPQIAAFEISKTMPDVMVSLLRAKTKNAREQISPSR